MKPLYPDFALFRKAKGKLVADILDPPSSSYSDTIPKAEGLAKFAEMHGVQFGRIALIHEVNGRLQRLDLKDKATRNKIWKAIERPHLDRVFGVMSRSLPLRCPTGIF